MKIGLTLSGGGARGISHLGGIQALEELGIFPDMITGTSAGAIVGALYAAGNTPLSILEYITKTKIFKFFQPDRSLTGLLRMERTERIYEKLLKENSFESLNIPLIVAATDLIRGETTYFSKGELIKPLQASSCIPVIFAPVEIDGNLYVDGGILNNMPVEPLLGKCDFIIGMHANSLDPEATIKTMRQTLERSLHLAINNNIESRKKYFNWFIEPPKMSNYAVYDVAKAKEIYQLGYNHTLKLLTQGDKKQMLAL